MREPRQITILGIVALVLMLFLDKKDSLWLKSLKYIHSSLFSI